MFASNSRYYSLTTFTVTPPGGAPIVVVTPHLPNPLQLAGYHRTVQGDRLDLLAARYLGDPTVFWKLCDSNNAPAPDALAAEPLVGIPAGPGVS
jgi:hypothetical protein